MDIIARKAKRDLTMEEQLARGPMDLPFLMLVLMLVGIGLIMMFSASFASAYYDSSQMCRTTPCSTSEGRPPMPRQVCW